MMGNALKEVLKFLLEQEGATDYQLNRRIMSVHGPEAVGSIPAELQQLGFAERFADGDNAWFRWRVTEVGEKALMNESE